MKGLKIARTCYDHLAGQLGVAVTDALQSRGWIEELEQDYAITPSGERFFTSIGIDLAVLRQKRRTFSRKCLDWSERKYHLAGALGHAILHHLLHNQSIERVTGARSIKLTAKGKLYLAEKLSVNL